MDAAASQEWTLAPDADYRKIRPIRYLIFGFMGLLAVGMVILLIHAVQDALPGGSAEIVVGSVVLLGGIVGVGWISQGLGRGADQCRVGEEGLTLVYRGGRTSKFEWSNPRLRIKLYELLSKGNLTYNIATRRPALNPIPQELFQTIISNARSRGFEVTEETVTLSSGHQTTVVIRAGQKPPQA